MLIRSQDRKAIVNLDRTMHIRVEGHKKLDEDCYISGYSYEGEPNVWFIEAEHLVIGEYTTEEKAMKVLDKIQKTYEEWCTVTFQMPQDNEV
jgi:hypothetical protein